MEESTNSRSLLFVEESITGGGWRRAKELKEINMDRSVM